MKWDLSFLGWRPLNESFEEQDKSEFKPSEFCKPPQDILEYIGEFNMANFSYNEYETEYYAVMTKGWSDMSEVWDGLNYEEKQCKYHVIYYYNGSYGKEHSFDAETLDEFRNKMFWNKTNYKLVEVK